MKELCAVFSVPCYDLNTKNLEFLKLSPQEILNELIAMESKNMVDDDKVRNLLAALSIQLDKLAANDIFSLIRNSRDIEEDEAYWACIRALHLRPDEEVFDQANAWSNDVDPDRRQAAADILARLGSGTLTNVLEYPFASQSEPIIDRLLSDRNMEVVCSALHACGRLNICEPTKIVKFATHEDPLVRYSTVHALDTRIDPMSLDAQIALSRDIDRDVRNWATFYLGFLDEIQNPLLDEALLERLLDFDPEIRGEALIGLAKRKNRLVLEPLKSELAGEFHGGWAIDAAWELKSPELIPLLEKLGDRLSAEDKEYFGKEIINTIAECNNQNAAIQP
jgi:HEAT repeat protein